MKMERLNKICQGWSESPSGSGLMCNPSIAGGIIDRNSTGEWFVIFNDDRKSIFGLETRDDAIDTFAASSITND